ncbi:MAG: FAD-dependent oxidoreductase [Pseudomonadota bacterium]
MSSQTRYIDIAIVGGGVAGLWTLNQLRSLGYSAALFEHNALGSSQTIASQGMIHGGVKYALSGIWGGSSESIAAMPEIWRQCLAGRGVIDLRATHVLSKDLVFWSTEFVGSRLSTLLASKLLQGRIRKLSAADYPTPLQSPHFVGQVYSMSDPVLDIPSLLSNLRAHAIEAIFTIDWNTASLAKIDRQVHLEIANSTIVPQRLLLTAGEGNQALLARLGSAVPRMQRRPLQQVMIKHEYRGLLYGHCIGAGSVPRLSISSHVDHSDNPIWYLGGELASASGDESATTLIERARREIQETFPWINFGRSEWATVKIDRAEPAQTGFKRPEQAYVAAIDGVDNGLVAWPTKLSLTPALANDICDRLTRDGIFPKYPQPLSPLQQLPKPSIATPCWDAKRKWTG